MKAVKTVGIAESTNRKQEFMGRASEMSLSHRHISRLGNKLVFRTHLGSEITEGAHLPQNCARTQNFSLSYSVSEIWQRSSVLN